MRVTYYIREESVDVQEAISELRNRGTTSGRHGDKRSTVFTIRAATDRGGLAVGERQEARVA